MSIVLPGLWSQPVGPWSLTINGAVAPSNAYVLPDAKKYVLVVTTLCGREEVRLEATPMQACTADMFARQAQIVASIGHVTRRACHTCRDMYHSALTPHEKKWLYQSQPSLGPILGMEIAEQSAGA